MTYEIKVKVIAAWRRLVLPENRTAYQLEKVLGIGRRFANAIEKLSCPLDMFDGVPNKVLHCKAYAYACRPGSSRFTPKYVHSMMKKPTTLSHAVVSAFFLIAVNRRWITIR